MTTIDDSIARRRFMAPAADGEISVLRFGKPGAAPFLFAHANGFCGAPYRQMFEAMGERFDIFAVDLRGFGATKLPADPTRMRSADLFAHDLGALVDDLGRKFTDGKKWIFAGHSLGATTMTLAAAGRTDVEAVRLIEPVPMPVAVAMLARTPFWKLFAGQMPLVQGAKRRRSKWPDRETVLASYAKKPLFLPFAPGVLADYLEDGLRPDPDGVALSCAPAWEAAVFSAQAHDFWGALRRAPCPFRVLAVDHFSSTTPPWALEKMTRLGASTRRIEGCTHLAPFEVPEIAARFFLED